MGFSRNLGTQRSDELQGIVKARCEGEAALSEEDKRVLQPAIDAAKHATDVFTTAFGLREADVHLGGHFRFEGDGSRHVSITVTVSARLPKE